MAPTDFLGQLAATERTALIACARTRSLSKGEYVFRIGDEGDSVFVLLHGRAKTYKVSAEGREVILWFCFPGEVFGLAAHPHDRGRMVSVQASESCAVAEIPCGRFHAFLDAHPRASALCLQAVTFRLGMLANRIVRLTQEEASVRVAKLILDLARRCGDEGARAVPVEITHQEIADLTGIQRQTVTRIVGDLTTRGALSARYRKIIVTDREALARCAAHPH